MRRIASINGGILVRDGQTLLGAIAELDLFGFDLINNGDGSVAVSGGARARSVTAYGAVGDGVTDDTAAIQAAIDVGPGLVAFPPGTFLVTQITRNQGVILAGSGVPGTTLLASAPNVPIIESPAPAWAASPTVRGGGVCDMLIDGTAQTNVGSVAINMSQNYDAWVARVTIQNSELGIRLTNSAYWNVLQQVRFAAVDDALHITNGANENRAIACHALQVERGVRVFEGADAGVSNTVLDQFAVERFSTAAFSLETTVANAVDAVTIDNPRIENNPLSPGTPGVAITGTVRGVTIVDPLFVNMDTFVTNPTDDTRIIWRAQDKNGTRVGVRNDFTTTSHGLLYWIAGQSRMHLRNSADTVFEPLQLDGVYMANSALFTSFAGNPENNVTAPVGSLCTDSVTGTLYRKTSGSGDTGWVTP